MAYAPTPPRQTSYEGPRRVDNVSVDQFSDSQQQDIIPTDSF